MQLFRKLTIHFIGAVVILLIGCLVLYVWHGRPRMFGPPNKQVVFPQDQATCLLRGGEWQAAFHRYECNLRTDDAGRVCAGSSDCDGNCLADISWSDYQTAAQTLSTKVTSRCSAWYINNGCVVFVEDHHLRPICGD